MSRTTARRYMVVGKLPSEMKRLRTWRTREDPFAGDWLEVEERLLAAPELEAKVLFEDLCERYPGRYQEGQLRTFQRRVREWRALSWCDEELEAKPGQEHVDVLGRSTDLERPLLPAAQLVLVKKYVSGMVHGSVS